MILLLALSHTAAYVLFGVTALVVGAGAGILISSTVMRNTLTKKSVQLLEEAKEKAIAVITELYGADTFDEYKYKHTLVSTYNSSDKQDGYSVTYQRYVFGIPTDDDISVKFNMSGEVLAINARGKGKLANAEKDITKEQIDNAIKMVNEQFSDKWSVHAPSIVIDSEGDYYVRIGISRNVNGQVTAMQLYINVQ